MRGPCDFVIFVGSVMTHRLRHLYALLSVLLLASGGAFAQFYTGSQQEFGQNRVQFRSFDWLYYPTENFEVYYYQGGKDFAAYVAQSAQKNLLELEVFYDFALEERVQIIVYNKQSEFRQSNIGIANDDAYNIGGTTRIVGSKLFVYFQDDYNALETQLREGLAQVIFNQQMYGGDWRELIKNSALLALPDWYEDGLNYYVAVPWNAELAAHIRDGMVSGRMHKFNRLTGDDQKLAGYALWKYVADVYGANVIPNILYMTRISRSIDNGFLFVLGADLATINNECIEYYTSQFRQDERKRNNPALIPQYPEADSEKQAEFEALSREEQTEFLRKKWKRRLGQLPVKWRKKYAYSEFEISPNGEHIAWVTNEMGQYKIWLYNTATGKRKRILKRDHRLDRITDTTYPILAWHPTSRILTYVFEDKGRPFIANYSVDDNKHVVKELFRIDKVVSMAYANDGRRIIFSGVREGRTDLYLYQSIGNNQEQLTFDIYDDLHPSFLPDGKTVIYASNRPDDTLRINAPNEPFDRTLDIYLFHLNSRKLERITTTPEVNELKPFAYTEKQYTFLGESNGRRNRYIASVDSAISRIDTTIHYRFFTVTDALSDWSSPPVDYQFVPETGQWLVSFIENGKTVPYFGNRSQDVISTERNNGKGSANAEAITNSPDVISFTVPSSDEPQIDFRNYRFEDDAAAITYEKETINIAPAATPAAPTTADTAKTTTFQIGKPRNYRLNFATDYVLTQVDNTFSQQFYQQFSGPTTMFPGISGLMKLGVSDLFEDHKIVGGFRLSGNLTNNDYGLIYENLSGRTDKRLQFMRQANRQVIGNAAIVQLHTHTAEYRLSYPFHELLSIRWSAIYRQDRTVFLSTDDRNLRRPNQFLHNVGTRLEYVYDNTYPVGLNLRLGTRYKLWGEYYVDPLERESDFGVAGLDIRHYERIHRELIFAVRLSASTSFGARRLVHYLGGVDNWIFQRIDNDMPISDEQNYFFQTLASPMRGFWVNSRNGNSFAVANAEVRWPIFKYLLQKPIKSDFVENFQVVAFSDVGTAWTGASPYAEENAFNQLTFTQGPVTAIIDNNREPIIWGYGFGLRSRLLGYFVRADWAWGVDDGIVLPRVFHVSLALDF